MKKVELNDPVDLRQLLKEHGYSLDSLVCIQIGCDDKIYILLNDKIPEREDGRFVNTVSNSGYAAVILDVDWYGNKVTGHSYVELGNHKMNFHMIQPMGEHLLLVGARCRYREVEGPEKNAEIVDLKGGTIKRFCFGDGIENCIVTDNGDIVISYFDEGIFGNLGWEHPIGSCGLMVLNADGEVRWKANRDICDCYAVNIDDQGRLWYYYYMDFKLVQTDLLKEREFDPQINGACGFLISADERTVIFDGGYDRHGELVAATFNGDSLKDWEKLQLSYNGKIIVLIKSLSFLKSKAVFVDADNRLFVKWFLS